MTNNMFILNFAPNYAYIFDFKLLISQLNFNYVNNCCNSSRCGAISNKGHSFIKLIISMHVKLIFKPLIRNVV